jgi:hypothetical protein
MNIATCLRIGLVSAAVLVWPMACEANAPLKGLLPMDEVEELTPELAAKYSKAVSSSLVFPRVKNVDVQTAAVLARHPTGVKLSGIAKLDAPVANELAKARAVLGLDGLPNLDPVIAGILATSNALLSLEGIDKLDSLPLAQKIGRQIGTLRFPRIRQVDKNVADALANGPITLSMPGLEELTHRGLAEKIAKAEMAVNLPNLKQFNADAAAGLCAGVCDVYLPSLVELPADAAKAFGQHEGVLQLHGVQAAAPAEIALLLTNNGPLSIGSIKRFSPPGKPVDPGILKAISGHAWPLSIGLEDIPADLAAAIKKRKAPIDLVGVKWLSKPLAKSLVGCDCMVYMMNVEGLEAGAADELLEHRDSQKTSGFVLPVDARRLLNAGEVDRLEKHECIHFGNAIQAWK